MITRHTIYSFLLIMMLLTGCRLAANAPIPDLVDDTIIEETELPADNNAQDEALISDPVADTADDDTSDTPISEVVTCTPQNPQWPVYTVQSGDTLARIASATASSINELMRVNCLNNSNLIYPGQSLRVPRLPAQIDAAPVDNPSLPRISDPTIPGSVCAVVPSGEPVEIYGPGDGPGPVALLTGTARLLNVEPGAFVIELKGFGYEGRVIPDIRVRLVGENCPGSESPAPSPCLPVSNAQAPVSIEPAVAVEATCLRLSPGTVTVRWSAAPANFAMIEFWTRSASGNTDVIGVDQDASDGAAISWTVPALQQPVWVYAIPYATGNTIATSGDVAIFVSN